ncbi:MAG: SDR family oxidoreductase [Rhodobacteraceae bacterium]|nr:SDR family oxidoreductase [Paracoccaceae bacterium]
MGAGIDDPRFGGGLSEFDYLVLSDDQTRQGALRFLNEKMEPLSELTPPVPRLVDLERLRDLAQRFERDPSGAEDEIRDLAGVAGSLGGARPKANVSGDGHLWIAKFTSERDTKPVERVEIATLNLADRCGLNVAQGYLELKNSDHPIALIRRFDRRGAKRIPYMSARTALDWVGNDPGNYTDIADIIRQISSNSAADLRELWRRVVFTILVSNSDDHLKNHGFLYAGGDRWRLSPAFDINPSPSRHRVLETAIMERGTFEASIELALEAAPFFGLPNNDARGLARGMAQAIAAHWRQALRNVPAVGTRFARHADSKRGRIVYVSSSAALRGSYGRAASYAAAKAGLVGLAAQIAIEYGPSGVTANVVAPSQIDTPRIRRNGRHSDAQLAARGVSIPLRRVGLPEDVAETIAFLCSSAAGYLTGTVLPIDGGSRLAGEETKTRSTAVESVRADGKKPV